MREKLADILQPVADGLSFIYVPAMWVLIVAHALVGILALLSPNIAKGQVRVLQGSGRIRLLGLYLLVLGVLIFSQATLAANPVVPQAAAVVLFLCGGTLIVIPALGLILVEWMLEKGPGFFRLVALVNILVAGLFYFAAQLRPVEPGVEIDPGTEVESVEGVNEGPGVQGLPSLDAIRPPVPPTSAPSRSAD